MEVVKHPEQAIRACTTRSSDLSAANGDKSKSNHPLYSTWIGMIARCHSENNNSYRWYGARGISVCELWRKDFWSFAGYMGQRPDGHTIDRINNDGNYEPGNCRWATVRQQTENQRRPTPSTPASRKIPDATGSLLTPAEESVLREAVRFRSMKRAAENLGLSLGTVKGHMSTINRKTKTGSQLHLGIWYATNFGDAPGGLVVSAPEEPRRVTLIEQSPAVTRCDSVIPQVLESLTARESEVVHAIATGGTQAEMAKKLGISSRTIEIHFQRCLKKIGVKGLAQFGIWYERSFPGMARLEERKP